MKRYANHKFGLIEDDDIVSDNINHTDIVCTILGIIAVVLFISLLMFGISQAKAEAKSYGDNLHTELCNLMAFNGSTYKCEE